MAKGVKTGGRKKGTPNKATRDIKALAQQYGDAAVAALAEIMRDKKKPPAARVAAAKELIDRGYGKATQPIAGDPDMPPLQVPKYIELVAPGEQGED